MNHIITKEEKTLRDAWLQQSDQHHFIPLDDARYPKLLKEIADPPAALYVFGDYRALMQPQIALVGSRNPSHAGLELAHEFAFLLVKAGLSITSGLAIGIDTASHEGALSANGKTIAVLGSGLLQLYPKQNKSLAEKISKQGCVISEWPLNMPPARENFPQRNRIISGLSLGTVVVEAALKSGSLITAKLAAEQNRDVFAIPGSVRNPTSQGCLALIQQGAKCVVCVDDILNEIHFASQNNAQFIQKEQVIQNDGLDQNDQRVLACIEYDVTTVDQICTRSKLSAPVVASSLLQLELAGVVKMRQGGYSKQ